MTITKKQTKELDVDIHSSMPRIKRISLRTLLAASYIVHYFKSEANILRFFNCLCQLNFYIKTVILPVLRLLNSKYNYPVAAHSFTLCPFAFDLPYTSNSIQNVHYMIHSILFLKWNIAVYQQFPDVRQLKLV